MVALEDLAPGFLRPCGVPCDYGALLKFSLVTAQCLLPGGRVIKNQSFVVLCDLLYISKVYLCSWLLMYLNVR